MRKAFTLAELLVGIAILSVMTVALFEVYSSVSLANRRLDRARELTAAVRAVTEEVSKGVREQGVDFAWYEAAAFPKGLSTEKYLDYAGSGADFLALKNGATYRGAYETPTGYATCDLAHSGACFLLKETASGAERLTPPTVTFSTLKFFVSGGAKGDGAAPAKVTVVAVADLVKALKDNASAPSVAFQTTVAERPYNHQ